VIGAGQHREMGAPGMLPAVGGRARPVHDVRQGPHGTVTLHCPTPERTAHTGMDLVLSLLGCSRTSRKSSVDASASVAGPLASSALS
jgi:hypothetical protein